MSSGAPPDYYAILEVSATATQQQIRTAYKRAALKSHPDRVPADSAERAQRTRKFQAINDAYYTLSDPVRRRDYDAARASAAGHGYSYPEYEEEEDDFDEEIPASGQQQGGGRAKKQNPFGGFTGFPFSAFGFGSEKEADTASEAQFGDVFEEMLREEGMAEGKEAKPTGKFWSLVGGLSGGAMGFIVANFTGAVAGAVAGNRLGAIRDAKGKSVYEVFRELPQGDKARLLSELAAKVFAHAVGS
ncbi:MAG: hypothetical protein GOMPHAMPRED_005305 [Gomphillus americanus]|uniref:J domain-containing protein n=1 Tax=Gomphillus americanus TaxID=1940652 RepID=A0A8H3IUY1_9LECA|nr:MAG: hypothetical protein GOMPHAMPRED_005305 [Gomphillus americanus]